MMLLAYLAFDALRGRDGLHAVAIYGLYWGNIYSAFTQHPFGQFGLEHLWSLAEEEQFYLVWPAAMILLTRSIRPLRWLVVVLVFVAIYMTVLVLHGMSTRRSGNAPDTHSEGLIFGSLLAFWRPMVSEGLAQGSLAVALLLAVLGYPLGAFSRPLFVLAAGGLVVSAVGATQLAQALSWRPLVGLGKLSYSLYLWHLPVLWAFGYHTHYRSVALALTFAIAGLSYKYIEQPFRRRRKRVAIQAPLAATAAQ
jgi:peptidoglycan/LPS O-acetylase OafA/YrhL